MTGRHLAQANAEDGAESVALPAKLLHASATRWGDGFRNAMSWLHVMGDWAEEEGHGCLGAGPVTLSVSSS